MTATESAAVSTGGAATVRLPTETVTDVLETAAVRVENGGEPEWLTGSGESSLAETVADRRATARRLATTVALGLAIDVTTAPSPLSTLLTAFQQGEVPVKDMSAETLAANIEESTVTEYRLKGTISSDGQVRFRSVTAFYETPWGLRDEPSATFEGADDRLVLSHREVVENAPEDMYLPGTYEESAHRHAVSAVGHAGEDAFPEFLWDAVIAGQVTDGWWENATPPFDFTELLNDEEMRGDLMYYAYRYNGWEYSVADLRETLDSLSTQYGDIPL